jgi:hypothetical protein
MPTQYHPGYVMARVPNGQERGERLLACLNKPQCAPRVRREGSSQQKVSEALLGELASNAVILSLMEFAHSTTAI